MLLARSDAIVLGGAPAAARRPAHDVWPLRRQGSRHLRSPSTTTSGPSSPPTASLVASRAMLRSGVRRAVLTTARRLRPPPPCPSRSHTRAQATHGGHQRRHPELHAAARCDDAARREDKDLPQTHFVFPNQTPTQTVSLIPTPRLYTKDRILACRPYVPLGTGRTTPVRGYTLYYIYVLVPDIQ